MGVARQLAAGNFFLLVTLPSGFTFQTGGLPAAGNVTLTTAGGGTIGAVSIFAGGTNGDAYVKFLIPVTGSFVTAPTFSVAFGGWKVKDSLGTLSGVSPVSVQVTANTLDANTNVQFDAGVEAANWISAVNALNATLTSTTATVDTAAASARKNFVLGVAPSTDTTTKDNDAAVSVKIGDFSAAPGPYTVYNANGVPYVAQVGDSINVTFAGILSGVKNIYWSTGVSQIVHAVTAAEVTAQSAVINVPQTNATLAGAANSTTVVPVVFEVDGTTQLTARTLTASVASVIAYNSANGRTLVAPGTITTWGINGTVLLANWANSNKDVFKSRFYLYNPSSTANATVTVQVFQIPVAGTATAPIQVGSAYQLPTPMGANAGMTIRLYEDVLANNGATLADMLGPDGSGNVAVQITIFALNVTGYTQTFLITGHPGFDGQFAFGTTPLTKIQ